MYIKRTFLFVPDKEKDRPDGKLRYRIKWDGNTVAFNVGYRVDVDKWSNDTQRCKNNTTHGKKKIVATRINREISRFEQIAESVFNSFELADTTPSIDEFRIAFNTANGKTATKIDKTSLFGRFDEFTREMGRTNQWTTSTFQKFATVRNHLTGFSESLAFVDLNEQGLTDYVCFLRDDKDMRNSTIKKQLDFLKWFLRWATAKEYNTEKAFETYSPKLKSAEKKVIFLEWDELMRVCNFELPENKIHLTRVRDVFCCIYTVLTADMRWLVNLKIILLIGGREKHTVYFNLTKMIIG